MRRGAARSGSRRAWRVLSPYRIVGYTATERRSNVANVGNGAMATLIPTLLRALVLLIHSLRLLVGGGLIVVGSLGVILPILPGMPFLILGSLLIGRRSRLFRRVGIVGKRALRRWAAHDRPLLARLGRWSLAAQRDSSRRLRHLMWWWQDCQQRVTRRLRGA